MRKKNEYSRIIQRIESWKSESKGVRIQLFHHCIENSVTSFYFDSLNSTRELGNAFSESQLSRDKVQLIGGIPNKLTEEQLPDEVDKLLKDLRVDYLDLLIVDPSSEGIESAIALLLSQGKLREIGYFHDESLPKTSKVKLPEKALFQTLGLSPAGLKTLTLAESSSKDISKMLFLEGKELPEQNVVEEFSEKYDLTPNEFLQAWILNHPALFHLVKEGKKAEIDAAVKAAGVTLIREDWEIFPKKLKSE